MSTNKQRREAERLRLQRQLEERREREVARRRFTTIASIVGALVLIAAVIVVVVVSNSGSSSKKKPAAAGGSSAASSPSPSASAASSDPAASVPVPTAACSAPPKGSTATFAGLTITGITDLKTAPKVTGKASGADPATLQCEDLVVGKGAVASTSVQAATVEYIGLVYKTGTVFQSSWDSSPATFGLGSGVIPGFSQGIAGAGKVAPMRVGGRRVILMPASTAYGANPPSGSNIPANAALVFVVDLQKIGS